MTVPTCVICADCRKPYEAGHICIELMRVLSLRADGLLESRPGG